MTIAEFIEVLKTLPQGKLVAIMDADTHWYGDKIHITEFERVVYLKIEYSEMDSKFEAGESVQTGGKNDLP